MPNDSKARKEYNFVLCPSFHGASLLAILLNNHPEIISLGDTVPTKETHKFSCSCGKTIKHCGFWGRIEKNQRPFNYARSNHIAPLYPDLSIKNIERINRLNEHFKAFFSLWNLFPNRQYNFKKSIEAFSQDILSFHEKEIFIDGTKDLNRCLSIKNIVADKIRVIHLIRDPRGYITSLRKNFPGEAIDTKTSALMWKGFHGLVLHFFTGMKDCDYLPVYYENLSKNPTFEMKRIFEFLGLTYQDVFSKPVSPHHIIGNKMIIQFDGQVKEDAEWKGILDTKEQREILEHCEPFSSLLNYKFELQ